MSTPLSSYDPEDRPAVIARRLRQRKGNQGLGYLAAKAASKAIKTKSK